MENEKTRLLAEAQRCRRLAAPSVIRRRPQRLTALAEDTNAEPMLSPAKDEKD